MTRALGRLPRHVEVGLRLQGGQLRAGLQLESPELLAGLRAALHRETVRELARRVLAALGPRLRCERCRREVYAVHLLRLRGIDEVHGLACPGCASLLKSFRRYGQPEDLEALSPLAVEVGLVSEQPVRFAGASLAFQMLPAERARLTARALLRRLRELCLEPHGIDVPRDALGLRVGGALLATGARVPEGPTAVVVALPGAGRAGRQLLARVREQLGRPSGPFVTLGPRS
jgi:hypothetical protein